MRCNQNDVYKQCTSKIFVSFTFGSGCVPFVYDARERALLASLISSRLALDEGQTKFRRRGGRLGRPDRETLGPVSRVCAGVYRARVRRFLSIFPGD